MPARVNKIYHDEKTKRLIRASALLNRLAACANGEIVLTRDQIAAAKIVIGKEIPDLSAVEVKGEVTHRYAARLPLAIEDAETWAKTHTPPALPPTIQ